jgi:WD40 repeat protein
MVSTDDDERQYWQVRPSRDAPGFYRLANVSQLGPISETEMPYANGGSTDGLWRLTPIGTQTSDTEPISIIQVDIVRRIESPDLRTVKFSPDGETIAASSGGSEANFAVQVWQTTDGALLQTFDQYTGIVWEIAFSPDGQTIVSVSSDQDNELHVWQLSDGALLQAFNEPGFTASSVAFSPDGKTLAVGGMREWPNGIVQLYDTSNWSVVRELSAPGQNVTTLAFSPDGSTLVGAGTDGNIRLWETSDGTLLNTLYHARQANAVAISPDGTLLATAFCALWGDGCEQGGTVVWQISDGIMVRQFDDLAESVAFSPDGKILVSGSGQNDPYIRLRSVEDWSLLSVVDGSAFSLDFSPDGTLLATSDSSAVSIWKIGR